MGKFIVVAAIVTFCAAVVLQIVLPVRAHRRATGKVVNSDSSMRKFVFRVNRSERHIIEELGRNMPTDELSCELHAESMVLKISDASSTRNYSVNIREYNGFSILQLSQIELIGSSSWIPYKLTAYIIGKLDAVPVSFAEYGEADAL